MPPATLRSSRRLLAALGLLFQSFLCTSASAQPERRPPPPGDLEPAAPADDSRRAPNGTPPSPALAPTPTTAIEFSPDPLYISQHGLRFRIPMGWTSQRRRSEASSAYILDPELSRDDRLHLIWTPLATEEVSSTELLPPDNAFAIRIQTPEAADATTPLDVLAHTLAQRATDSAAAFAGASAEAYAIFEKQPDLVVSGRPAYRFYMRIPRRSHETGLVLGYTLFDLPGPAFLILELTTPEENYQPARAAYETVAAAAEFLDPAAMDAQRQRLMLTASRFIASRTPEDIQAAMARVDGRMERLYAPGGTGADRDDRERGVRRIFSWTGQRGEIDPDKAREAYNEVEKEEGYIVFVGGRYFDTAEDPTDGTQRRITADFSATYWMSKDRQREAWLYRMQIQTPFHRRPDLYTEVGARDGDGLTVWTKSGGTDRTIRPIFETQGYLSQVEFHLFADLLAAGGIPTDFGYYVWQTSAETCRFIHDAALPESDGLGWTIHRVFGDNTETHYITFDGELRWRGTLREVGQSLTRCQPTDLDRLTALWRAKNLPMEALRDPGPRRRRP